MKIKWEKWVKGPEWQDSNSKPGTCFVPRPPGWLPATPHGCLSPSRNDPWPTLLYSFLLLFVNFLFRVCSFCLYEDHLRWAEDTARIITLWTTRCQAWNLGLPHAKRHLGLVRVPPGPYWWTLIFNFILRWWVTMCGPHFLPVNTYLTFAPEFVFGTHFIFLKEQMRATEYWVLWGEKSLSCNAANDSSTPGAACGLWATPRGTVE